MKTKIFLAAITLSFAVIIITGNALVAFAINQSGMSAYIAGQSINLEKESGAFKITASAIKYIVISPSVTTTLNAGGNQVFAANAFDQDSIPKAGINISWTVSNSSVGNVNPPNVITNVTGSATSTFSALSAGTTMVNAANGSTSNTTFVIVINQECSDYWDVNKDSSIDIFDLVIVANHFGQSTSLPYPDWDINKDGTVDIFDLVIIANHFGESSCW